MIIRHLHSVHALLSVLDQPNAEIKALRRLLYEHGHLPSRRTLERRLAALPERLPAQIGALGRHLVDPSKSPSFPQVLSGSIFSSSIAFPPLDTCFRGDECACKRDRPEYFLRVLCVLRD
jgi:hypothetical protein